MIDEIAKNNSLMFSEYLTFSSSEQIFAFPISYIIQIISMTKITPIPEFPKHIKGVINFRDMAVPVVDVRMRLKQEQKSDYTQSYIIICDTNEMNVGFIVDAVLDVVKFTQDDIDEIPQFAEEKTSPYITGVSKKDDTIIMIIDTNKVMSGAEMDLINENI